MLLSFCLCLSGLICGLYPYQKAPDPACSGQVPPLSSADSHSSSLLSAGFLLSDLISRQPYRLNVMIEGSQIYKAHRLGEMAWRLKMRAANLD